MTRSPQGERGFRMLHSRRRADGSWSSPRHLPVYPNDVPSVAVDMAYSPDGRRLYFLGRHVHELSPREPGLDIWFSERSDDGGWGLASPVPPPVWTEHAESYPSFTPDGTLQFSSDRPGGLGDGDLWRAAPQNGGEFRKPVNLGPPVNTEHRESDSCVAPDGSYIVFTSDRPGGFGGADLWVSFLDSEAGSWSEPKNLGAEVNGPDTDYCPMLTPDGRYLFFSRRVSDPPDSGWDGVVGGDVYWVDTAVFERLR